MVSRLSHKPSTAGTLAANATIEGDESVQSEGHIPDKGHYSLGQKYRGQAQCNRKSYGPRNQPNVDGIRLNSSCMGRIKCCFICGKSTDVTIYIPYTDVKAAIKRRKERHPTALLSVTDLDTIMEET